MKKLLLSFMMFLMCIGLAAQSKSFYLPDQRVEPPRFNGVNEEVVEMKQAPICCFLQQNIDIPKINYSDEGIIGVEFTVNPNGELSHFKVTNTLNYELEDAVISCIKKTNGKWQPGLVNGQPSAMEKRVYVKFDATGNRTFEELARDRFFTAVKLHNKGLFAKNNKLLTAEKRERQSTRFFNKSLNQLDMARRYYPNSPSLAIWKAFNYEQMNNKVEMQKMIKQQLQYLSMQLNEQNLESYYNMALITD